MLSRPLPLDVLLDILHHTLPNVSSVKDVDDISHFTDLVDGFRLINDSIKSYIDKRPWYFAVCFVDLTLAREGGLAQEVIDALRKRCLKTQSLALVIKFAEGIPGDAIAKLVNLLHELRSRINAIHLYAPDPIESENGVFIFQNSLLCWFLNVFSARRPSFPMPS